MPLPRAVARFNKRYTNRFIEPVVRRVSGFALVQHQGRSSGNAYRTPVNVFELGDHLLVALTYGPSADWVQNVLAGPATIDCGGRGPQLIVSSEVVDRETAWSALPLPVRAVLRTLSVRDFLLIDAAPPSSD